MTEFTGLDTAPLALGPGVKIVLHASRLERLAADSVVYFRGIQVGVVQDVQISNDGAGVDIHAFIWKRYAPLVRSATRFWVVAGVDVKGGIFSGITMKIDSLRAILAGGVSFATPEEDMGDPVQDGERSSPWPTTPRQIGSSGPRRYPWGPMMEALSKNATSKARARKACRWISDTARHVRR